MRRDGERAGARRRLLAELRRFAVPDPRRALFQVSTTLAAYFLAWYAAYRALEVAYAVSLILTLPAAGLLMRIFVLQHDLGHGSLFRSRRLNDLVGSFLGVLTLVPYHHWRRIHNLHHRHSGNLDRRGPGYVTTLTVDEYLRLPPSKRLGYRIFRHPLFMMLIGGPYYFIVQHRYAYESKPSWGKEKRSVHLTNLAVLAAGLGLSQAVGLRQLLLVQVPILLVFGILGVFVILNQHSAEDVLWVREDEWDFVRTALAGSTYFRLPKLLQWLTANVGFHHVHHLRPDVPNYRLEACHEAIRELRQVEPLTLRASLSTVWMALWDEERRRMIGFRDLARERAAARPRTCGLPSS